MWYSYYLLKKLFFLKYNIIVLVTQVAFDICSPSVFCMLDFHFENQWFPYVVNDMFGEYGVNCKTEYLDFSLLQLKQLGHSVDKVIKMNFIYSSALCVHLSPIYIKVQVLEVWHLRCA